MGSQVPAWAKLGSLPCGRGYTGMCGGQNTETHALLCVRRCLALQNVKSVGHTLCG